MPRPQERQVAFPECAPDRIQPRKSTLRKVDSAPLLSGKRISHGKDFPIITGHDRRVIIVFKCAQQVRPCQSPDDKLHMFRLNLPT